LYPFRYICSVYSIETTDHFEKWLKKLKDIRAKARILTRIKVIETGNLGDHKSIGGHVSEIRITYGPGYRLYYTKKGDVVILLLIGGDKSTQSKDIEKARSILAELEEGNEDKN